MSFTIQIFSISSKNFGFVIHNIMLLFYQIIFSKINSKMLQWIKIWNVCTSNFLITNKSTDINGWFWSWTRTRYIENGVITFYYFSWITKNWVYIRYCISVGRRYWRTIRFNNRRTRSVCNITSGITITVCPVVCFSVCFIFINIKKTLLLTIYNLFK